MNQILSTKLENPTKTNSTLEPVFFKKKKWFKFQFAVSIFIIMLLMFGVFYYFHYLKQKEEFSNHLIANYNIYRLYSASHNDSNQKTPNGLFRNY